MAARQTKAQQIDLAASRLSVRGIASSDVTGMMIYGLPELQQELDRLPGFLAAKVLRGAVYEAAQMMADSAYRHAPRGATGQLAESIKARRRLVGGPRLIEGADVFAKRSPSTPGGYYAHLVELGHAIFKTTRHGKYFIKHYPGERFMTKTAQREEKRAVDIVRDRIRLSLGNYYAGKRRL